MTKPLQSHGKNSKVYVPVLRHIFEQKYRPGDAVVEFTMKDIFAAVAYLGLSVSNRADIVYRMKSRTEIPPEIQELGFRILRPVKRGHYRLEKADSTLIEFPDCEVEIVADTTPSLVRQMIGEEIGAVDEQALLSLVRYNNLLSRFLKMRVLHLKGHVRKSVEGVGQAEVDDVHIAVPSDADEPITIVPVEAKGKDEPINRAQIVMQIIYARSAFPGHPIRPITIKLFETGEILFIEFADVVEPAALVSIRSARYALRDIKISE